MTRRPHRAELRQEHDALPAKRVVGTAAGAIALVIALVFVSGAITRRGQASRRPSGQFPETSLSARRSVSGVQLTAFGRRGVGRLANESARRDLARYRWVDRERRLVSIPVDRAMDLVVEAEKAR